jgi:hypothetical protein
VAGLAQRGAARPLGVPTASGLAVPTTSPATAPAGR